MPRRSIWPCSYARGSQSPDGAAHFCRALRFARLPAHATVPGAGVIRALPRGMPHTTSMHAGARPPPSARSADEPDHNRPRSPSRQRTADSEIGAASPVTAREVKKVKGSVPMAPTPTRRASLTGATRHRSAKSPRRRVRHPGSVRARARARTLRPRGTPPCGRRGLARRRAWGARSPRHRGGGRPPSA